MMKKIGHGNKIEAHGMYSSEGEYVEFGNPVLLEGICLFVTSYISCLKICPYNFGLGIKYVFFLSFEKLLFNISVYMIISGPVEAWLCDIERTMRWTLKEVLKQCKIALKKMLSKRDKWIKEWPGQVRNIYFNIK